MLDIFSNLAIRHSALPSPEVLQPRLPTLFEPSQLADESRELILDQPYSLHPQAAGTNKFERPSESFDDESPLPNHGSIQEPPAFNIKDPSHAQKSSKQVDMESGLEIPIAKVAPSQPSQTPSETILTSFVDIQNDQRWSATIYSDAEGFAYRRSANDPQRESVNPGERILHPRAERLTGNQVGRLVEPSRDAPGRVEKSMDGLQTRDESSHTEPPVVRIHIGRIDVRAITPAPAQPASKPAPVQPRLTLDDYLRQREGRR